MKRLLQITWLFFCTLVLSVPLRDIHNGEAHILFLVLIVILTFPVGYLLANVIGLAGYLLDRYLGLSLPPNEVMLFPLWLGMVALGYYQWFVLLPKLWSKWRGHNAT